VARVIKSHLCSAAQAGRPKDVALFARDARGTGRVHGASSISEGQGALRDGCEYNQRLDSLVGTCGNKGEFHQCDVDASVVIGEGDDVYEKILQAHRTQQLAGYLSIAIIVPLCKKLPSIVICAFATCNRFTAEWVRRLWQRIEAGVAQFVSPILGPFEGHGSDGDARRAKLQWEDMHQLPKLPGRFGLDAPSFTMSARIDGDGAITGIHAQDPHHNLGKLYSHFDSTARQLHPGAAVIATHEDVRTVFETFNSDEHGLAWSTINRDDRMNKEAPARACSLKVQDCLQKLIAGRAQDPRLSQPAPQMAGSLQYVTFVSRYLLIFFGKTLTNEQRIQNAGFVDSGESSLLHDVRLMAMVFLRNTHVIAVHRDEAPDGRITFRKYDNDSDARRRGTFETVSARQLWVGSCEMVAITQRGSALHRAVGDLRPMGSLREQRVAELRAVLGGFGGLGALLPLLERAQIRSLSMLRQLSVEELRTRLNEVSGSPLSLAYLDRLPVLGLCKA
jgi:hypothetical protein